ncbi:DUF938 domain-containing protein [Roseovarius phycicola]|uniref:DUF938 domain-containing protein n=1 Tax=Roseovarius phycicola TaxID=3080976 RepID=A0ABZ2HM81_9RHOB
MPDSPPPPRISVAHADEEGRMHAPAAERNADAIAALLQKHAPQDGHALEIASGTGQHVAQFARVTPGLIWHPTDVAKDRLASINLWARETHLGNIEPSVHLDATLPGWHADHRQTALILLVNLLHLISTPKARILISEAAQALVPGGRFIFYGPFLRDGSATSEGDRRFHASLQAQDPEIGYKNDADVVAWVKAAGLQVHTIEDMPANNLAFVTERPKEQR